MMDKERYDDVITQAIFDMPRIMDKKSPDNWYVWNKKIPMKEFINELIKSKKTRFKALSDLQSRFLNRLEEIYEFDEEACAFDIIFWVDSFNHPEHYDYITEINSREMMMDLMEEIRSTKNKMLKGAKELEGKYVTLLENAVFYMLNLGVWRWYCWDDLIKWFNIDDEEEL